jgi:hypothetical protein
MLIQSLMPVENRFQRLPELEIFSDRLFFPAPLRMNIPPGGTLVKAKGQLG